MDDLVGQFAAHSLGPHKRIHFLHAVPFALLAIVLTTMSTSCNDEATIVQAPPYNGNGTTFCSNAEPCPAGQNCEQGVCIDEGPGFNPPDTVTRSDTSICDNIPNAPGCIDVSAPTDTASVPDSVPGDTAVTPTDIVFLDTGNPDVEPAEDECGPPGNPTACDDTPDLYDGCRVDEASKGTTCVGSTTFGLVNAPCASHQNCDLLLGCHFGRCVPYCNVLFGTLVNAPGVCPPQTPTCKSIGHPEYGACAAQ